MVNEPFSAWETPTLPGLEYTEEEQAIVDKRDHRRHTRSARAEAVDKEEKRRRLAEW